MSNDFTVQTNSKTFTKFIDSNGNGVKDSGEKFATIDFTNDGDKAKTFKMRGDVSLFTTNEIASNLSTRSFASSSTSLPTENGKVKINPCNEYSVGDLANTLKNGGSNGSSAYGATGSVTTTSTTNMLPSEYYENIGKLYSPVITTAAITDDVSGYSKNASNFIELEAAFLFGTATTAQTTTQTSSASSANSNAVNGFALDPNSSTTDGACSTDSGKPDCTDVEKQLADAQKALADAKKCKSGFDENGKCKDDSSVGATPSMTGVGSAGNGNDTDSARNSGNHHGLTERGDGSGIYASSDANTDIPVIFNKDQWLSKTAIAMYGKGAENDADLIEALAILNKNAINNGNASDIDEGACLTFPQQLEYKGKFYSMEPANRDKDKVQVDADKVRLEIGSSKSGHSAAARREAGISTGSVAPHKETSTQAPQTTSATTVTSVVPKVIMTSVAPATHAAAKTKESSGFRIGPFQWMTFESTADKAKDSQPGLLKRLSNKWDGLMYLADYGYKAKQGGGLGVIAANEAVGNPLVIAKFASIGKAELQKPENIAFFSGVATQVVEQKLDDTAFLDNLVAKALISAGQGANKDETHKLVRGALENLLKKENGQVLNGLFDQLVGDVSDPANKSKLQKLASLAADMVFDKIENDPKVSKQVDLVIDRVADRGNVSRQFLGRSEEKIKQDRTYIENH